MHKQGFHGILHKKTNGYRKMILLTRNRIAGRSEIKRTGYLGAIAFIFLVLSVWFLFFSYWKIARGEQSMIVVPDDYPTIQEAVSASYEGDIIFVRNGAYYESVTIDKTLTLVGEEKDLTVIDGNGTTALTVFADHVRISNFTIKNSFGWPPQCGIHLMGASYCTIANNLIIDNSDGIGLDFADYNSIFGNRLTNNSGGVYVAASFNNSIFGNNFSVNHKGVTVLMSASTGNCIFDNNIVYSEIAGIDFDHCFNNTVSGNNIADNQKGIAIFFSDGNRICGNTIANSSVEGIGMLQCDRNAIYHNNFINNSKQAYSTGLDNTWDDCYPSGGNYWSDYSGSDRYTGPYQNETGSDGLGDTPYIIDTNNKDNYPLMKQYVPTIDMAVLNVTSFKSIIGQGHTANVSITIANQGSIPQPPIITLYANITPIHIQVSTLEKNSSATIIIEWRTTNYAKGNYTLAAVANLVAGETNTTNNTFIDSWVYVGIAGDVDGNHKVDMSDLYLVALNFGRRAPYETPQRANCDINNDGVIGMFDLYIVAVHYGQTDP